MRDTVIQRDDECQSFEQPLELSPLNSLVKRSARQISAHTKPCLDASVIAGKLNQGTVTHPIIEELGFLVRSAHF
jgi:hypothetical protein